MKRLRIPFAIGAATIIVMTLTLVMGSLFFPITFERIDVADGHRVFNSHCASCHKLEDAEGRGYGPSLATVYQTAKRRGLTEEEHILESIIDPSAFRDGGVMGEMPENLKDQLSTDELLNVTAYLSSRHGKVNYRQLLRLRDSIQVSGKNPQLSLSLSSVERGRELYFGELKCAECHPLDGLPHQDFIAPSLAGIGNHGRQYLQESILNPSKHIVPGYETHRFVSSSGQLFEGRRLAGSESNKVKLLSFDEHGNFRVFVGQADDEDSEESSFFKSDTSYMPTYRDTLAADDLSALLDFLQTLQGAPHA